MTDDSPMPFGKLKGTPLGKVRESYWTWFIEQEWAEHWGELLDYCQRRLARKFAPVRKKREPVLTRHEKWVGNPDAWKECDGTCPF